MFMKSDLLLYKDTPLAFCSLMMMYGPQWVSSVFHIVCRRVIQMAWINSSLETLSGSADPRENTITTTYWQCY